MLVEVSKRTFNFLGGIYRPTLRCRSNPENAGWEGIPYRGWRKINSFCEADQEFRCKNCGKLVDRAGGWHKEFINAAGDVPNADRISAL